VLRLTLQKCSASPDTLRADRSTFRFSARVSCVMAVKSPAGDGSVVAEAEAAAAHPRQAQQRLPARVRRQEPRVDGQSQHVSQRADRPADAVQLLRSTHDASVVAPRSHGILTPPVACTLNSCLPNSRL